MIQKKIAELKKTLREQALRVGQMLEFCIDCYKSVDEGKLTKIAELEKEVNSTDLKLEKMAVYILALQTPHAKTLREVLIILKVNTELERIGDLCDDNRVIIEKFAQGNGRKILQEEILQMLSKTQKMYKNALRSFFAEDSDLAKKVCQDDDMVDDLKDEVLRKLIENNVEIEDALLINNFSKNVERIADLATNIAQGSIFIDEGKEVRHCL